MLADAGVPADADGETLSIAGLPARFAPHAGEAPADAYDRLVRTALMPVLLGVAKERLEPTLMPLLREPDLQVIETPGGLRVLDAFGPVADISGSSARMLVRLPQETMARNGWRQRIVGNFLVVDAPWHYATRCIRGIARLRLLEGRRRGDIVRTVAGGVHDSGLASMVAASRRLRTERTIAYGHPVRLLLPDGIRIRIDPVWRHRDELVLDFSVAAGTRRLSGSLVLSEPPLRTWTITC